MKMAEPKSCPTQSVRASGSSAIPYENHVSLVRMDHGAAPARGVAGGIRGVIRVVCHGVCDTVDADDDLRVLAFGGRACSRHWVRNWRGIVQRHGVGIHFSRLKHDPVA